MSRPQPTIIGVERGSPADGAGVRAGERLVSINGRGLRDIIDYRYLAADAELALRLEREGRRRTIRIAKDPARDLGLRFASELFDGVRTCANRCVFCFVHQLPRGLRRSLYLLDDDYRLSFLHGNFVTLTNLGEADLRRIVRLRLSPLYVSVHATDPAVRRGLLRGPGSGAILPVLRRLARGGIQMHAQVVLGPGLNDGDALERTVTDLAGLHPGVASLAIVPVGLTRHRARLARVRPVRAPAARALLGRVRRWQRQFLAEKGSRFVFAADELYLMAEESVPAARGYEGFPQLENGVGLVRRFLDQVRRMRVPPGVRGRSATVVTGALAAPLVQGLADRLNAAGARVKVAAIRNRLLGESVMVAGLLAGRDVIRQLRGRRLGRVVIVPGAALRDGAFLDDVTLGEVGEALGLRVAAATAPGEVVEALIAWG